MPFINDDFMLQSESAKHLYHDFAKDMPIYDFHCHLSPQEIAEDHEFANATELFLGGDHYKWRGLRAMGYPEALITGDAAPEDKFKAWAETVPNTIGNPLFHWNALELKRYFGIDEILSSDNWKEIYDKVNTKLQDEKLTARQLIKDSNVTFICTTDNPFDSLEYHKQIAEDDSFDVDVVPGFRPDGAFKAGEEAFVDFLAKMEEANGIHIDSFAKLMESLEDRIKFFGEHGSHVSDHGLKVLAYADATEEEVEDIFQKAAKGQALTELEYAKFQSALLVELMKIYKREDFVFQIHFGAIRDNSTRMFEKTGFDSGLDSINDQGNVAEALNRLLDAADKTDELPKTIIYPLNPTYFDLVATTLANFQGNEDGQKSRCQLGSGWWFNDTKYGMLKQFKSYAEAGLLMNFVGMLTDSRSFTSYTRHEYFRRLFCDYIGDLVERGEIPNDDALLEKLITNVCYNNAVNFFYDEEKTVEIGK
ncbi:MULTISPECIES: glucuronate isomerase [Aerococcus]|uniref:Uronate isomerase n=1 Tax=Aerococcus sanguinicola TaxID=119206 RepID=A0A5N1GJG0_9LACT|nr:MULTISPECIES: glucuronate isomerase [Aerococcus]KAA9300476.1 glucuronate isomerase [Aerococcus sanguinicola]MDK6369711.1 glucuronate isomerase [Aerococcus sp. UMB9870]MDK6680351.1 glucuronate isomerase [Aerococcus sp. UMB8608]MDK6940042.1 glucuronate isomerase [Aerococcus sp. UMB8487]OFK21940.1 uronate isomerase [Aerococcus sp. HMSC072A12]